MFLGSVIFKYRHHRERIFETVHQNLACTVRLSRKSLDELVLWLDYLKRGEERWVLADEFEDNEHTGSFYTLSRVRGTCQAARQRKR